MKKYELYVDEKLILYTQIKVAVEASNEKEAKKIALDPINWKDSEINDYFDSLDIENTADPEHQDVKEVEHCKKKQ